MSAASPFDLSAEMCWPTLFFHRRWSEHEREAPALIELLYGVQAEGSGPSAPPVAARAKSEQGLYESDFNLFTRPHPSLRKLLGFISTSLAGAVCHADAGRVEPAQLEMAVTESWFHIARDGGFHDAHLHPNCSWCGIYYLQIGDSGPQPGGGAPNGGSRFYTPFALGYRDWGNRYLFEELDAPIEDGLLVLFPSYLRHSGLPYRGTRDRIVIAFNARVFLKGVPSDLRP
ncbi:MAG TPA: putative 2OG-Fe(II) oxygenase [Gemmataceae bacterium]|nr:putative 2OG-Fe(II) oxygenase [Gemmataceae bacterium]